MSYELLRGSAGIQWPCTEDAPKGTERIYLDSRFNTDGRGLRELRARPAHRGIRHRPPSTRRSGTTGAPGSRAHRGPRRRDALGRLPAGPGDRPHGRTTSTPARRPAVRRSSTPPPPTPGSRSHPEDAEPLGVEEGDLVRVESARGSVEVPARVERHPARSGLPALPLRRRRPWRAALACREPADGHGVGPGVEAARLQGRSRAGHPGGGR